MRKQQFIGPAWDAAGNPILVKIPEGRGYNRQVHLRRTKLVIDDFGNAVMYQRRCWCCMRWLPLTFENFCACADGSLGMSSTCVLCSHTSRSRYENTDKGREAKRRRGKESHRRKMADPALREAELARSRAAHLRRKAQDPELVRKQMREARRRYVAKLREDPDRYRQYLEVRRMNHRLVQERKRGVSSTEMRIVSTVLKPKDRSLWRKSLPGEPLAEFIQREVDRRRMRGEESPMTDLFCHIEFDVRSLSRWAKGDRANVRSVDQACVALGVNWWDIYDPAEFPEAVELFEGETKAA